MKLPHSTIVALDGESKCGTTTIVNDVAAEAMFQGSAFSTALVQWEEVGLLNPAHKEEFLAYEYGMTFNQITCISAGNMFRAATLYAIERERQRRPVSHFSDDDRYPIQELLATDSIIDRLQNDPIIGKRVSPTARMPGIQKLCGALFSDLVTKDYFADGGSNLVIVDARNPVATLFRNDAIGDRPEQIHPASIVPLYIETPLEVAARRMGGVYSEKLEEVRSRRHTDATREELPVTKPDSLKYDYREWLGQFNAPPRREVAEPFYFENGEHVTLGHIQRFAGYIATAANDVGLILGDYNRKMVEAGRA